MWMRLIPTLFLTGAFIGLSGCGTPYHETVRADARSRVDAFNAQLSYDQAEKAFSVGRFDTALRQINDALERFPDAPEYHVLQGRIYLETHRLEEAIESFMGALEVNEEYAEALYFAGIVFQRWSDDESAYEKYQKAYELEPSNVQYLLASAESLVALGELNAARELVTEKLSYFEYNSALRHLLGQIEMLEDRPQEAVEYLTQARLMKPDDLFLLEELAWAQYLAGQYSPSYDSLQHLQLRLPEPRTDLMHLEARCLAMMERNNDARNLYLKLSKLKPEDVEIWVELGAIAWDLGDYRRVAQSGMRATSIAPDRHEGFMLRGVYEQQKGNLDEARKMFEKASQRAEGNALPYILLGNLLEDVGDYKGAQAAYAAAQQAEPTNPDAQLLWQQIRERQLTVAEP